MFLLIAAQFITHKFGYIILTISNLHEQIWLYLTGTGCRWKLPPHDLPQWRTVYELYRKWLSTVFFDRMTVALISVARSSLRISWSIGRTLERSIVYESGVRKIEFRHIGIQTD